MKLSVIVATYNRKDELKDLLESFSRQTLPPEHYEVIIVDDGSTDGTDLLIKELKLSLPFPIHYYYQPNQGPGRARTVGMQKATGDIFIFVDSDCIVPPHYLENVRVVFETTQTDAFGGPDRTEKNFSPWDKAVNYTMTSFLTTGGIRGSSGRKLARYYPRSFNMGLRRSVYEKIGGFGSLYHYGEDIEFSHRILTSGAKVAFVEDAFVYHRRRASIGEFARQIYKMGRARVQLYRIDPTMLEPLHLVPAIIVCISSAVVLIAAFPSHLRSLALAVIGGAAAGALFIGVQGALSTRSVQALVLVPLALTIQVFAYGIGMIVESLRSGLTRKNTS